MGLATGTRVAADLERSVTIRLTDRQVVITRSSDRMNNIMESLILAQNERWRRVLSMQVERQGAAMHPRAADW